MKTICCIGAGNVSWHFATRWLEAGYRFTQVYSRNIDNARSLASELDAKAVDQFEEIDATAEIYFFGLSDDGLRGCIDSFKPLKDKNVIAIHCSGNVPSDILAEVSDNYGVIYPFQSLRKKRALYSSIPICITAHGGNHSEINKLANSLSEELYVLDDHQRSILQLSGVFSNNFITHLVYLAENLLEKHAIDTALLKPILDHTLQNLQHNNAYEIQTGPAVRNDLGTINRHLDLLDKEENLKEIYQIISSSIKNTYHEDR